MLNLNGEMLKMHLCVLVDEHSLHIYVIRELHHMKMKARSDWDRLNKK